MVVYWAHTELEAGTAGQGPWSRAPESGPPLSEGHLPGHLSLIFSKLSSRCSTVEKGSVEGCEGDSD